MARNKPKMRKNFPENGFWLHAGQCWEEESWVDGKWMRLGEWGQNDLCKDHSTDQVYSGANVQTTADDFTVHKFVFMMAGGVNALNNKKNLNFGLHSDILDKFID